MKEFNVGQVVVITDNNDDYTTYRTMANDVMKLSNWQGCTSTPLNVEVKIVAKAPHIRTGVTIYGVEDESGKQYVVGGQYFKSTKPTRTEYVKVTDSIFDLRPDLEAGELYFKMASGDYHNIDSEDCLIASAIQKVIYRRIEKEVDWKSDIKLFIDSSSIIGFGTDFNDILEIEDHDAEFLEICRIRLRATGELPTA